MADGESRQMGEETISSRRAFEGRLLTLEVDQVRAASGIEVTREVIRHPGAAVVLPVLDDGRIILVRQYRYPVAAVLLELPAGKLDNGEAPRACAVRELAEETGLCSLELEELGSFFAAPGFSDELLHAFLARGLRPADPAQQDADEVIELEVMTPDELRRAVAAGAIRDAKSLATLLLAQIRGLLD